MPLRRAGDSLTSNRSPHKLLKTLENNLQNLKECIVKIGKQTAKSWLVLALLLGFSGCNNKSDSEFKSQEPGKTVAPAHLEHPHGPHDGHMADLGTDHTLMVEITYKADPREIAVYVVDHNDPKKAVALEAKSMTLELHGDKSPLTLSAEPQEGDPEGKASKFMVAGTAIPESVKSIEDIEGDLKVEVGGKMLEADFGHDDEHGEGHAE